MSLSMPAGPWISTPKERKTAAGSSPGHAHTDPHSRLLHWRIPLPLLRRFAGRRARITIVGITGDVADLGYICVAPRIIWLEVNPIKSIAPAGIFSAPGMRRRVAIVRGMSRPAKPRRIEVTLKRSLT